MDLVGSLKGQFLLDPTPRHRYDTSRMFTHGDKDANRCPCDFVICISMLSYVTALVCNAFAILPFYINRTRHLIERGIHVVPISQMRVNRNLAEGLRRARNYPDRSSTRVDGLYMSES